MLRNYSGVIWVLISVLLLANCSGRQAVKENDEVRSLPSCSLLPNCVSSQDTDPVHKVAPFGLNGDPDTAFSRLRRVLAQRSDVTIKEESRGYIRVEMHTLLFTDDGEFLLDRENKVIRVRSSSRIGVSDLNKNRSRMEEIRRQFLAAE